MNLSDSLREITDGKKVQATSVSSLCLKLVSFPLFLFSNSKNPHVKQHKHGTDRQSNSGTSAKNSHSNNNKRSRRDELDVENLPWPEMHRSRRTQGIMTGVDGEAETYRKTVGECEIEVGRHKHARDETVLLCAAAGDGCSGP